jgi:hypothetical protein
MKYVVSFLAILALALTGCSGDSTTGQSPPATTGTGATTGTQASPETVAQLPDFQQMFTPARIKELLVDNIVPSPVNSVTPERVKQIWNGVYDPPGIGVQNLMLDFEAQLSSSPEVAKTQTYHNGLLEDKCQPIEISRAEQSCLIQLIQKGENFPLTTNDDQIRVQFNNVVIDVSYNNPTTDEATTLATTKKLVADIIALFP